MFYKMCDMGQIIFDNKVYKLSNYDAGDYLQEVLTDYGNKGYKLVNVVMVNNWHGVPIMYLFFTKEMNMSS